MRTRFRLTKETLDTSPVSFATLCQRWGLAAPRVMAQETDVTISTRFHVPYTWVELAIRSEVRVCFVMLRPASETRAPASVTSPKVSYQEPRYILTINTRSRTDNQHVSIGHRLGTPKLSS